MANQLQQLAKINFLELSSLDDFKNVLSMISQVENPDLAKQYLEKLGQNVLFQQFKKEAEEREQVQRPASASARLAEMQEKQRYKKEERRDNRVVQNQMAAINQQAVADMVERINKYFTPDGEFDAKSFLGDVYNRLAKTGEITDEKIEKEAQTFTDAFFNLPPRQQATTAQKMGEQWGQTNKNIQESIESGKPPSKQDVTNQKFHQNFSLKAAVKEARENGYSLEQEQKLVNDLRRMYQYQSSGDLENAQKEAERIVKENPNIPLIQNNFKGLIEDSPKNKKTFETKEMKEINASLSIPLSSQKSLNVEKSVEEYKNESAYFAKKFLEQFEGFEDDLAKYKTDRLKSSTLKTDGFELLDDLNDIVLSKFKLHSKANLGLSVYNVSLSDNEKQDKLREFWGEIDGLDLFNRKEGNIVGKIVQNIDEVFKTQGISSAEDLNNLIRKNSQAFSVCSIDTQAFIQEDMRVLSFLSSPLFQTLMKIDDPELAKQIFRGLSIDAMDYMKMFEKIREIGQGLSKESKETLIQWGEDSKDKYSININRSSLDGVANVAVSVGELFTKTSKSFINTSESEKKEAVGAKSFDNKTTTEVKGKSAIDTVIEMAKQNSSDLSNEQLSKLNKSGSIGSTNLAERFNMAGIGSQNYGEGVMKKVSQDGGTPVEPKQEVEHDLTQKQSLTA